MPESSFRIKGNSSSFHIIWSPTNVEWGTVFYCVGSKALQVRIFILCIINEGFLLIFYVYYCIYLLMYLFLNRNSLFLLQHLQIGQTTKLNCKYKASCPVSLSLRPAQEEHWLSSSSGLAAGVWNARRGAPSAQRCVRKPFTVTQWQKHPQSCRWDSLCLNVKSSLHPHLILAHLASFTLNSKGRLLADCYASLQCHRSWWNNSHSHEEKLCLDLVDQLDEGNFRKLKAFLRWEKKLFFLFYAVSFHSQSLESEWCLHPHNLAVPSYQVDWLEPFTLFDFTVTPYTHWGKAPATSVSLRAPEGGTRILNPIPHLLRVLEPGLCQQVKPGEEWAAFRTSQLQAKLQGHVPEYLW